MESLPVKEKDIKKAGRLTRAEPNRLPILCVPLCTNAESVVEHLELVNLQEDVVYAAKKFKNAENSDLWAL